MFHRFSDIVIVYDVYCSSCVTTTVLYCKKDMYSVPAKHPKGQQTFVMASFVNSRYSYGINHSYDDKTGVGGNHCQFQSSGSILWSYMSPRLKCPFISLFVYVVFGCSRSMINRINIFVRILQIPISGHLKIQDGGYFFQDGGQLFPKWRLIVYVCTQLCIELFYLSNLGVYLHVFKHDEAIYAFLNNLLLDQFEDDSEYVYRYMQIKPYIIGTQPSTYSVLKLYYHQRFNRQCVSDIVYVLQHTIVLIDLLRKAMSMPQTPGQRTNDPLLL